MDSSRWNRGPQGGRPLAAALWTWPAVAVVVAVAAGIGLSRVPTPDGWLRTVLWPGDAKSLSTLVQVVGASVITVATLTFSVTVVALQLASQQFSPRLLREFTRDKVTKAVLAVLVGTFAFAVTLLREMRSGGEVPVVAGFVLSLLSLLVLCALLGFITHVVRMLRVDTMMLNVHDEAGRAIEAYYPPYGDPGPRPLEPDAVPAGDPAVLPAQRGGFLRRVDVEGLVATARDHGAFVQLLVRAGDHVVHGTPLALAWADTGGPPEDAEAVTSAVHDILTFGYERTLEQDSAFGFRQLEDIAVKALSPGINDPVTAAHAIGHMSDLLVRLTRCRLGPTVHEDDAGRGRAVVPDRDLRYYLDLACGQVRRYGAGESTVLVALLRMLRDVAVAARDEGQRAAVVEQADRIVAAAETAQPADREPIEDLRDRVTAALEGRLVDAYGDRAGETRSI
ncbi:DUF2254 domain-containing protein [Nocardioides sp. SYSU DS0663]|uniref:DUF2254 domain-containing protein n=1 Tax=Nocardioides sp. SYSU DS0663 TaxID=3416445 RepID=UPI003F4B19F0